MNRIRSIATVGAAVLSGCATTRTLTVGSHFDPAEVAWFQHDGTNTIRGNALLRTVSGEVRTCAGLPANLTPVSTYARERMHLLYGDRDNGLLSASRGRVAFASTDPEYQRMSRHTRCDSQGNFTFSALPDGDYFVTALVVWGVPLNAFMTATQGGYLMQRVHVAGGGVKEIVLTAQ